MTPWTSSRPSYVVLAGVTELEIWPDLEDVLVHGGEDVVVAVAPDGPVLRLARFGTCADVPLDDPLDDPDALDRESGHLVLTDPAHRLRAQDRRRLHRLGLRPDPQRGHGHPAWSWTAPLPPPPDPALGRWAQVRARTAVAMAVREQGVAVLRDALRVEPARLHVVREREPDEQDPDLWDDDGWDDDEGEEDPWDEEDLPG